MQNDDRHIALQTLLLVDCVLNLARVDHVHDRRAKVKARMVHGHAKFVDGLLNASADVRAYRQDGVDVRIGLQASRLASQPASLSCEYFLVNVLIHICVYTHIFIGMRFSVSYFNSARIGISMEHLH